MATTLVKYAKMNGSKDNISVIVLKFWCKVFVEYNTGGILKIKININHSKIVLTGDVFKRFLRWLP